jgi:hypothetical protein
MPVPGNWLQQRDKLVKKISGLPASDGQLSLSLEDFAVTEQTTSWPKFLEWLNELHGSWCFRGQRESSWWPETFLDRAVKVEYSSEHGHGYGHLDRETEQRELLFRFQQQAPNHISPLPAIDDICSWLALMQHYGAPTQLLDWTKSPYVALYFALEDEPKECSDSAVWAINLQWLEKKGQELLGSEPSTAVPNDFEARAKYFNDFLHEQKERAVIFQIDPLRISERMVAQQGIFLCKLWHKMYFSRTLIYMMSHPNVPDQPVLRKLTVEKNLRINFLKRLREMNIHGASLYPGLDGIGKSLKLDMEIKTKSEQP